MSTDRFFATHVESAHPDEFVVWDHATDLPVASFHVAGFDADAPYVITQANRADHLANVLNAAPRFKVGDRVEFTRLVEVGDIVAVDEGSTGTIINFERGRDGWIAVQMDYLYHAALLLDWDGAVYVYGYDHGTLQQAVAETLRLIDTPAPAYTLDGEPVNIIELLKENWTALNPETGTEADQVLDELYELDEVGKSVTFGGGAAAAFVLARVR